MSLRKRQREAEERRALDRLRGRILSGIHAGHLNPGDRLPSYRELAAENGVQLRAVGRIYDTLEREGLVEVRGKTGVYVASQEQIGGQVLAETARWVIGVLREGWSRRIPVPELPDLLRRCVSTITLQTACVESTEDQLVYLCQELRDDFGLDTTPLHMDRLAAADANEPRRLPAAIRNADLLVTTMFHASALRPIARETQKPLVVIRLDQDMTRTVERYVEHSELTVVCIDPRFGERVRSVLAGAYPERIHPVLANNRRALARLDPDQPILLSRAARDRLHGTPLPPGLLPPGAPIVAAESAAELIGLILRRNLEALRDAQRD